MFGGIFSGRRGTILAISISAVAIGGTVWVLAARLGGDKAKAADVHCTCDNCKAEWDAPLAAQYKCPKCGSQGVTDTKFHCPQCNREFVGAQIMKLGPGQYKYRLAGKGADSPWLDAPPVGRIECPNCHFKSDDFYSKYMVRPPHQTRGPAGSE